MTTTVLPSGRVRALNVVSNAAYLAAGHVAAVTYGRDALLFLVATGVLAAGSAAFHAVAHLDYEARRRYQMADEVGMYCVFSLLALRAHALDAWPFVLVAWLLLGLLAPRLSSFAVLAVLGGAVALGLALQGQWVPLGLSAGLFGLAFAVRHVDEPRGSGPLHVAWHVLTAVLIWYLFTATT